MGKNEPPSPSGWPVLGHSYQYLQDPFGRMEEWASLGDVVRLRFPGQPTFLVTDPALIEDVLLSGPDQYERGAVVRRVFGPLEQHALSAAEGENWRRLRNQFQHAFTRERIESYETLMTDYAADQAAGWTGGQVIDIELEMRRLTLRILAKSMFDLDVREDGAAVRAVARAVTDRSDFTSLTPVIPHWVPTPTNRRFKRAIQSLRSQVEAEITERTDADDTGDDFLSMLLAMQDDTPGLTVPELRDNVIGFLWAGQDTTALALSYVWYLLATHPEVRARLDAELGDTHSRDQSQTGDRADRPYLDKVITEALRLYPPAPTTLREPIDDVEIGGYEIPGGSAIILPQWVVHRDEQWYDDPETFRPDRWTASFEQSLPDYAYFPFGGGPRHCIGMRFARTEMRRAVSSIASQVRFESLVTDPLSFRLAATLKPKTDLTMRVHRPDETG